MCERITFRVGEDKTFQSFNPVLSILSYLLKAPLVPKSTPVVNALFKQRSCIENIFRLVDYDSYHELAYSGPLCQLFTVSTLMYYMYYVCTMYQRKVDVDMLNAIKSVLADVSNVST